ncbi:L,D-transpeptidase family protein [Sphingomicrobium aestuariivivum]|uniref:L,D-transpeptidase family protein n=1 Tax=Sphingomicrobium aestuariivivum TaxID=1582356 RepID=UPI001FD63F6D|nr:L,D-transpeptidase [Sphingomicrobium aestuariivivum]MCJ8190415.1 L,D-transpeptidase [Sphingomicrobium aestuariivivum]
MSFSRTALAGLAVLLSPTPLAAQAFPEGTPSGLFDDKRQEATLEAQVLLARVGHSPGVIDGYPGGNTARALEAFQEAEGLEVTGRADGATLDRLRAQAGDAPVLGTYVISADDVAGGFTAPASGMEAQAETGNVGYGSAAEMLAEKFGMGEGFLRALNPGGFGQGQEIIIANATMRDLPAVARIEVDGGANELRAYGESGDLVATFPATVGSSDFPSPSGSMEVNAIAPEASYTFDPSDQDWGGDKPLSIPAGPNNPVGGIWIDLSKDGYGIHGSPDPALIGKTSSHGCVRLTNWDARRLLEAVSPGTEVDFV